MKIFGKESQKNQNGTTLVELLIYMGLLAILLLVLTEMFVAILNVKKESEAASSVLMDGRYIMSRLSYDINRADSISTPASLGGSDTVLVLSIDGDTYTYAISGDNLELTVSGVGADNLNSTESQISDVGFQRLGNAGGKNSIKFSYTVTSVVKRNKGADQKVFNSTAGLR